MDVANQPILSLTRLAAWCGIVAGLLEVGTIILRKYTFDSNQLYGMTHHFVWMIPLTNLGIFAALGMVACLLIRAWPRHTTFLAARGACALTILPLILVALPRIHGLACLALALGIAAKLVPILERRGKDFHRFVRLSFLALAPLIPIIAAGLWATDHIAEWRQRSHLPPPTGSPNVLLVVLDSVAASHLGLHGYERPSSPTMDEISQKSLRFDSAQATSSWTLLSHAGMFTGRPPHELSAGWLTPLDGSYPTLAEFLESRGYATAGFVANTAYCARDSGLARGFATYHDYVFPQLTMFRMAALVQRTVGGLQSVDQFLTDWFDFDRLEPVAERIWLLFNGYRKEAALINRQFLDWQSQRSQPNRPFFAFLNYFDAHWPYELRHKGLHRFGIAPRDSRESKLIRGWSSLEKTDLLPEDLSFARDAYDDCVADLDEQIGCLIDELARRDILDNTWVIITADHGESFGEHAGIFCHGTSLYQTELRVPLMILPPAAKRIAPGIIKQSVSLGNLAATITDIAGNDQSTPFPGESLARYWSTSNPTRRPPASGNPVNSDRALAEVVPKDPMLESGPRKRVELAWPIAAIVEEGWSYIRRDTDEREQLFHIHDDANELHNLANDPVAQTRLDAMRHTLNQLTAGPLTKERFRP